MGKKVKVTIAGAGVSGSYLARLLHKDYDLKVFDPSPKRGCKCAWLSIRTLLDEKLRRVGLPLSEYVLCIPTFGYINKVGHKFQQVVTFDKRRLLSDLTEGIKILQAKHPLEGNSDHLLVNATGEPFENKHLSAKSARRRSTVDYTVQWKMSLLGTEDKTLYIWWDPTRVGYGWAFPLDEEGKIFHVGAATIDGYSESVSLVKETLRQYRLSIQEIFCGCWRPIYVGKDFPLLEGESSLTCPMVSIGEGAGCVHPFTGEGILPSIESAEFLAQSLNANDNLYSYLLKMQALRSTYQDAYEALETLKVHKRWGMIRAIMAKNAEDNNSEQQGMPLRLPKFRYQLLLKFILGY